MHNAAERPKPGWRAAARGDCRPALKPGGPRGEAPHGELVWCTCVCWGGGTHGPGGEKGLAGGPGGGGGGQEGAGEGGEGEEGHRDSRARGEGARGEDYVEGVAAREGTGTAEQEWAQPRLACCTTGSGGGDEPRRPAGGGEAVRHGCVAGWAGGVAHLLAGISGAGQVQHRVGTAPSALLHHRQRRRRGGAARVCGGLGRWCRTLACWHQWGWAGAAQGWGQPRLACCTTGSGGGDGLFCDFVPETGLICLYCVTPVCVLRENHRARRS